MFFEGPNDPLTQAEQQDEFRYCLQRMKAAAIERLFAWLHNFRRIVIRREYYPENFLRMVSARLRCHPPEAFMG
jgi:hypothetical protein